MTAATVDQMYEAQIKQLPRAEQLRLVAMIAGGLALQEQTAPAGTRSILELEGVGAELWQGVDAHDYINQLRDEWDERS